MARPTQNKVFLNDDNIVEIHVVGDQTHQSVMAMGDIIIVLLDDLKKQQKRLLVLDDVTQMGNTDTAVRQAVSQLARTMGYEKVAMLGPNNPLMKHGTRLLLMAIGMGKKIKYFVEREAAIKWLQG